MASAVETGTFAADGTASGFHPGAKDRKSGDARGTKVAGSGSLHATIHKSEVKRQ